jgi:hypothetical protein
LIDFKQSFLTNKEREKVKWKERSILKNGKKKNWIVHKICELNWGEILNYKEFVEMNSFNIFIKI